MSLDGLGFVQGLEGEESVDYGEYSDDFESDEEVSDDEDGEGESTFPFHDANARVDQSPARAPKNTRF